MARRLPWAKVKKHRTYSFEQVAGVLGVHKNTVRNWVRNDGLEALTEMRPNLIIGAVLREFLRTRQADRKQPLGPHEIYCFSCRKPRHADPALVEDVSAEIGPGRIRSLCPVCLTMMNRTVTRARLRDFTAGGAARANWDSEH